MPDSDGTAGEWKGYSLDIRFDEESKKRKTPTTRLYTPTKTTEAEPVRTGDTARVRTNRRAPEEPHVHVEKPGMTPLGRIGLIISGFILSGMILFTLAGYERISRAYADINALNTEIDSTKLRINELDVQIECAVTIQDAQKVAEAYGMRYPDKSQYIKIGDPLPFSGGAPTDTSNPDTAATTAPDTTPDPNAGSTDTTTSPDGGGQPSDGG